MAERDSDAVTEFADAPAFIHRLAFDRLPEEVVAGARRSLLDLIGVAAAGSRTRLAAIASAYAATQLCGSDRSARILFDGRRAVIAGAAFAGASTIDALDGHDGHALTKGHAGAALLPALLAVCDAARPDERAARLDGRELLTCLVLGYEVATRAGMALHATVTDYHCSGAWNALGCAAIAARLLALDDACTRHALGIAEYFGPRGQILRACDSPTMVKDGSGWGAHAGVTAALLARDGFTGAPALTVERDDAAPFWSDLGARWRICEQYFKPYPVCRWAQPAIEAALELQRARSFAAEEVASIAIESFDEAVALGSRCAMPRTTEEAQYSLAFPVAAALVFGRVGVDEVAGAGLGDSRVGRLVQVTGAVEDAEFSQRFPAQRWARVRITLADGRTLVSNPEQARGNPENPLSDDELRGKYRKLATPVLGGARAERIEHAVDALAVDPKALRALLEDLLRSAVHQG
ncbi:MAG TPA: MmgE/PrpD family protein [Casimicrobiaceae bacterium]|nr:MmgE/PrpD family protein [Casimicrobiaceae bacterium]